MSVPSIPKEGARPSQALEDLFANFVTALHGRDLDGQGGADEAGSALSAMS
jgi:hypothetical protein